MDAIDHYPDFLNAAVGGARPIARLAGVQIIAGMPILVQLLVFPPATRLELPTEEFAYLSDFSPQTGYPMLMMVQDFHNPDISRQPGPITDYCAPRETLISFLPPESVPAFLVNPQTGSYTFTLGATSKRDADGDGFENSLDTCPFVANLGNPTALASGDADQDGLDAACDPNDDMLEAGTNSDEDGDGYLNRQDNCPLVPNGLPHNLDGSPTESPGNQSDRDFDDVGDVCDQSPHYPDGKYIMSAPSAEAIVGDASGSGGPPKAAACPHCYRLGDAMPASEAEGEGGQLAVAIGLIGVGAGAATVVVGSGALYLLRRRRN